MIGRSRSRLTRNSVTVPVTHWHSVTGRLQVLSPTVNLNRRTRIPAARAKGRHGIGGREKRGGGGGDWVVSLVRNPAECRLCQDVSGAGGAKKSPSRTRSGGARRLARAMATRKRKSGALMDSEAARIDDAAGDASAALRCCFCFGACAAGRNRWIRISA